MNMNAAYLHLLINHVPVILAPLGFVAALIALVTRHRTVWLYALATITLAGLSAYPVMATGDGAADVVRKAVPTVQRQAIHRHGDAGDTTMWVLIVAGVAAAYGWWRLGKEDRPFPLWLAALVVLTSGAATAAVTYTSYTGGFIIHNEAHQAVPPGPPPGGDAD